MNLNEALDESSKRTEDSVELQGPDTNEIADERFAEVVKRLKTAMIHHPDLVSTLRGILEPLQGIERLGDTLYSLDILNEAEQAIKQSYKHR